MFLLLLLLSLTESFQNVYLVVRCVYNAWKSALVTGSGFGSLRESTLELNFTNPYCTFSRPNKTLFWKNMSSLMIIWKWLCSLGWVFFYRFLCENLLGLHLVMFKLCICRGYNAEFFIPDVHCVLLMIVLVK